MTESKLWCLYHRSSNHLVKALSFDEVRAICSQFRVSDLGEWFVWQEGWEDWVVIMSVPELFQPSKKSLRLKLPAFPGDSVSQSLGSEKTVETFDKSNQRGANSDRKEFSQVELLVKPSFSGKPKHLDVPDEATLWPEASDEGAPVGIEKISEQKNQVKTSGKIVVTDPEPIEAVAKGIEGDVRGKTEVDNFNGDLESDVIHDRELAVQSDTSFGKLSENKATDKNSVIIEELSDDDTSNSNRMVVEKNNMTEVEFSDAGEEEEEVNLSSVAFGNLEEEKTVAMQEEVGPPKIHGNEVSGEELDDELDELERYVEGEQKSQGRAAERAGRFQSKDVLKIGAAGDDDGAEAIELTSLFVPDATNKSSVEVVSNEDVSDEVNVVMDKNIGDEEEMPDIEEELLNDDSSVVALEFHRKKAPFQSNKESKESEESQIYKLDEDSLLSQTSFGPLKKTQNPEDLASREFIVRHYNRYPVEMQVLIESEGRQFETGSVDLSVGGIRLRDPLPSWIVGYCKLRLTKDTREEIVDLTCYIVEGQEPKARYRVALLQLQNIEDEVSLEEWLACGTEPLSA